MATRRTIEFLDGENIKYKLAHHSPAFSALDVAATTHIPGRSMAKTVVVEVDGVIALAVVPATREVEMAALRSEAQAQYASLAEPEDFATRFEGCQLGTMPPLGNLFGMQTYVDSDAGSHSDVVVMRFADYRRVAHPTLGPISVESSSVGAGRMARMER